MKYQKFCLAMTDVRAMFVKGQLFVMIFTEN